MISFIPRGKEGNAKAGIRAGGQALFLAFIVIPYLTVVVIRDCWRERRLRNG